VGKKKTLQYRIRWKGYSPAHDSWEPAIQVYTPELIKEFQKTKSSQGDDATINYHSASGIQSKPNPLKQPWAYSFLPRLSLPNWMSKQTRVLHLEKEPRTYLSHGWKTKMGAHPQTVIKREPETRNVLSSTPLLISILTPATCRTMNKLVTRRTVTPPTN
jgi:hypothetical protein